MTAELVSHDEAERRMRALNDACTLCGKTKKVHVDHDHTTGLIRGLLCRGCNAGEGNSDAPRFVEYRANPPIAALGIMAYHETHRDVPQAERDRRTATARAAILAMD